MDGTAGHGNELVLYDRSGFAWKVCDSSATAHSVKVAEEALDSAIEYSSKLKLALQAALRQGKSGLVSGSSGDRLEDWIGRIDSLVSASKDLEILVGVAGDSGLGKTALLNALLGYRDLLPSSNQSAATATVCQIAWNDDPNPKKEFKAEIVFRRLDEVKEELERFFDDLKTRREMRAKYDNPPSGDESDSDQTIDQTTLDEIDANISDGLEKIEAVWGLEMDQLESMTVADVLSAHSELAQLLSSKTKVWNQDLAAFSKRIKPYLDSTEMDIGGNKYKIWPLIDHVRLFVKSDILRNHVVLVDLPGLSDAVGTRSAVAMRFFQRLDITCIVSPGHRGADNRSATQLIGSNLEMAMKLDGRFNCQRFCAVLTKIDDIDYASFVNDSRADEADLALQEAARRVDIIKDQCKQLKAKLQIDEDDLAAKKAAVTGAEEKMIKAQKAALEDAPSTGIRTKQDELRERRQDLEKAKAARESQNTVVLNLTRQIELRMRNASYYEGILVHQCITARNVFLRKKIEQGYEKAQKKLGKNMDPNDRDVIQVFPTSSRAFWAINADPRNPPQGFCDLRYTGIPYFKSWIRTATIPRREAHARALLNSFHEILNQIETWSNDECQAVELKMDRLTVQRDQLEPLYAKARKRLDCIGEGLAVEVNKCDPLSNRRKATAAIRNTVRTVVERWCYVDPRDPKCSEKLHWLTFRAIINRRGGTYQSTGRIKKTFTWMEDMATDFLDDIVETWNQSIHVQLPKKAIQSQEKVGQCWDEALCDIADRLRELFPAERVYLDKQIHGLLPIRETAKDMVTDRIKGVAEETLGVHADVSRFLQSKWNTGFDKALKESGKGQYSRQRKILDRFAKMNITNVYTQCIESVNQRLKENLAAFPESLDEAWNTSMGQFRKHVDLILDNIFGAADATEGEETPVSEEQAVQREIRQQIVQWKLRWRETVPEDLAEDVSIPEGYDGVLGRGYIASVDDGDVGMDIS